MTPTSDNPSPTPLHEPINAVIDATVKEAVQESSGPEARETPQGSSLLVLNYGDSSTLDRKRRSTYQCLMTLLNRWEYQRRSIIRMERKSGCGGDMRYQTCGGDRKRQFEILMRWFGCFL